MTDCCVEDAFGRVLRKGSIVVYAGRDNKDRLTFFKGMVDVLGEDKVRIIRVYESTKNGPQIFEGAQKRVWVETWKVSAVV